MFKSISQIKKHFKDNNHKLIIIEDGFLFIGSLDQLEDCFGITEDQLEFWCKAGDHKFEVISNDS